jgi:hypothetical protein
MAFSFDPSRVPGDRVLTLAVRDEAANVVDVIAENGEVAGDPERPIRLVTLDFLAGGGDGYPLDEFATDVVETEIDEQQALADYLAANYRAEPFDRPDAPVYLDERIQNLSERRDTVSSTVSIDLKANGRDDLLITAPGADPSVSFSLDPGSEAVENADWWILARTPQGLISYDDANGWQPGIRPAFQRPLSSWSETDLYNEPLSGGTFIFYFIVDDVADGILRLDGTETVWLDFVFVQAQ